jgi:hypothetical protein
MRRNSTSKIVRRADVDIAVAEFKEMDVPHVATVFPRSSGASGDTLRPVGLRVACYPKPDRAKGGGAGGIRTLDRALQPYNGLANRRLQPLGHSSVGADMPDAGASRKRQIQVTPGPFSDAIASGAARAPIAQAHDGFSRAFAISGAPFRLNRSGAPDS